MGIADRRDVESEPTTYQMKLQRLKEDGRLGEFRRRVRERMRGADDPSVADWGTCSRRVMDAMLPDDDATMIEQYRERVTELEFLESEQERLGEVERERSERHRNEFEKVFSELPTEASSGDIMSWIENHPAMNLRDDSELSADDIRDAPSRAAVGNLRHWLENKDEFYKSWLQRAKRDAGLPSSAGESEVDEDLRDDPKVGEIDSMLAELEAASRVG